MTELIFRAAVRLYPARIRGRFGAEMLLHMRTLYRRQRSWRGRLRYWRTLVDGIVIGGRLPARAARLPSAGKTPRIRTVATYKPVESRFQVSVPRPVSSRHLRRVGSDGAAA